MGGLQDERRGNSRGWRKASAKEVLIVSDCFQIPLRLFREQHLSKGRHLAL